VKVVTESPLPVVLPLHPRTDARLKEFDLKSRIERNENIKLLRPAGYFDMLVLMKKAHCILTDSGGIQEEACSPVIKKRVFVMRKSTERPEAVRAGYCKVVGTNSKNVLRELRRFVDDPKVRFKPCPYGRGDSGERIASILRKEL
jgi:UDP-N-acetylglucosamine 2-epimerase (non-hydrolysing)